MPKTTETTQSKHDRGSSFASKQYHDKYFPVWYQKNKDKQNKYKKQWNKDNADKYAKHQETQLLRRKERTAKMCKLVYKGIKFGMNVYLE